MNFPGERPKFTGDIYVLKLLAITVISYLFLYGLVTYHWKGFEKNKTWKVVITLEKTIMSPGRKSFHLLLEPVFVFPILMLLRWRPSKSIFNQIW
jgi:hypothetical protein